MCRIYNNSSYLIWTEKEKLESSEAEEMCNYNKWTNIHVTAVPEEENKKEDGTEKLFKEIMSENFFYLVKM